MNQNLFIPKKVTVGFNKRSDTFTGKLAFIVYKDEFGNIKKEKSFNNWIDKNIEVIEIDNKPESGFILNRDIKRDNYRFSSGRNVIRVYDSRNFEFEITPSNLIGVLANSDCSKNEIIEKCVYAWNGTELILLPENSVEYQESIKFTDKQSNKFSVKNLVKGYTYADKKTNNRYIYLGLFLSSKTLPYNFNISDQDRGNIEINEIKINKRVKNHIFYNIDLNGLCSLDSKSLSHCIEDSISEEYENLLFYANESIKTGDLERLKKEEIDIDFIKKELDKTDYAFLVLSNSYCYKNIIIRKKSCSYKELYEYLESTYFIQYHYDIKERKSFSERFGHLIPKKEKFSFEEKMNILKDMGFKIYSGQFSDGTKKIIF